MANIDLGSFTFDAQAVDAQLESLKKKLFELKQEQGKYREENRELNKTLADLNEVQELIINTGGEQTKVYKDNQKAIQNLNKQKEELFKKELKTKETLKDTQKEYRETSKLIGMLVDDNGNRVQSTQAVSLALDREIRSIEDARKSNKELLALRNKLDLKTDEGVQSMERLNDKLNENNQFVKESVSGYEQQKINIGNYEGALENALGPLGEFATMSEEAGGVMPLLSQGLMATKTALIGVTKAALGFILTPIGAVIAVLAAVFLLVKNAMNRSEEATNSITKAFSVFGGFIQKILELLEPLGTFLIDGIVLALELVEESFYMAMQGIANALSFLGFDDAAKSVAEFTAEIKEAADTARELEQAQQDLEKINRKLKITLSANLAEREKLKNIRDDESKSIKERIKANEDLGKILDGQLQIELESANQSLLVAQLKLKEEGANFERVKQALLTGKEIAGVSKELLDETAEAISKVSQIEQEVTEQRNEQITNRVSLENELIEKIKERQQLAIEQSQAELDLFIAQQGYKAKSLQEEVDIARGVRDKKLEILEQELKAGSITQTGYEAEKLNIKNDFLKQQAEASVTFAEQEMEIFKNANQTRIDNGEFLNQTLFEQEKARLDQITQADRDFQAKRLEEGLINEQQYNDAINTINEENRLAQEELKAERETARKEKEAIDLENKRIADQEKFISEFELRAEKLEQERLQEVENAKQTGADITAINAKYAKLQGDIEEEKQRQKLELSSQVLGGIAELLGKETVLGKAAAVAQAVINTYLGATKALSSAPPPFNIALAAITVGAGLKSVAKIVSTKPDKAERGARLRGKRHSQGGMLIEAEDGEMVINRRSASMFPELLSDINVAGGGIPLAARGLVAGNLPSNNTVVQNRILQSIDFNQFSESISDSVRQGAMEGSATGTMTGSQAGLIGLSENRQIQKSSAF